VIAASFGRPELKIREPWNTRRRKERYLVAAPAGRVALQPGEIAAGVDVQEVRLRRVADAHGHIVQAAKEIDFVDQKMIFFSLKKMTHHCHN